MSAVFGALSLFTYCTCIQLAYLGRTYDTDRLGSSALLATIFMITGFILGVISVLEHDKFRFFRILGIVMNVISFFVLSAILYARALA